ncbi:MAG: hypothetical protein ACQCN6_01095 [Candidatus Bathyarchaeia archaeon]
MPAYIALTLLFKAEKTIDTCLHTRMAYDSAWNHILRVEKNRVCPTETDAEKTLQPQSKRPLKPSCGTIKGAIVT